MLIKSETISPLYRSALTAGLMEIEILSKIWKWLTIKAACYWSHNGGKYEISSRTHFPDQLRDNNAS